PTLLYSGGNFAGFYGIGILRREGGLWGGTRPAPGGRPRPRPAATRGCGHEPGAGGLPARARSGARRLRPGSLQRAGHRRRPAALLPLPYLAGRAAPVRHPAAALGCRRPALLPGRLRRHLTVPEGA